MVKDLALSLLQLGFDPWPENFHMPWMQPKKKKKKKKEFLSFGVTVLKYVHIDEV